jgi:hypothetical protein
MADSTTAMAASIIVFHHGIGRHHGLSGRGKASCPALALRRPRSARNAPRRAVARLRCHSTAPPSGATRIISVTAARRGPLAFRGPQFMQCSHPHPEKGNLWCKGGFGWLAGLHRGRFQFDGTVVVCLLIEWPIQVVTDNSTCSVVSRSAAVAEREHVF